jgi:CRISPR-associated protein Cas5h
MVNAVSFNLEGDYAAFRDPSVTTNQTVYVIPSKSAIIGLLGGMLGFRRPNTLGPYGPGIIYTDEYLSLLKATKIGIQVNGGTRKIAFFTNHRSLKESKTKPFKTELLLSPSYTIYVKTDASTHSKLAARLKENNFEFTPTLGHSYCIGRVSNSLEHDLQPIAPESTVTSTVIIDEIAETNSRAQSVNFSYAKKGLKVIVERHLHHYFDGTHFERKVLRHWIPIPDRGLPTALAIESYMHALNLAEFYRLDSEQAICLY